MTLWCAAVIPAAGGRASTGLPAPITLQGVGGVKTNMPGEQVQRVWGISLPMLEEWGSSRLTDMPESASSEWLGRRSS